jgi:hypothetical protein
MHHTLFVTKCDKHGFNLGTLQMKLLALGDDFDVSSLGHIKIRMTYLQLQWSQENWGCLYKPG